MVDKQDQILQMLDLQRKQINNINDQLRTVTAAMDVLSRAIQELDEKVKFLEENAHA